MRRLVPKMEFSFPIFSRWRFAVFFCFFCSKTYIVMGHYNLSSAVVSKKNAKLKGKRAVLVELQLTG